MRIVWTPCSLIAANTPGPGSRLLATLVSVALYLMAFHPDVLPYKVHLPAAFGVQPHRLHQSVGNSRLGLAYGIISYAIFIFAVLLNTRKKFPSLRVGRAQTWLRAHIWLTILTLPLVFMHAAFHFGGMMTSSLMWLYLLVMFSGFYGLALQQFMPRLIKSRVTLETIYEEIPFLKTHLLSSAMKMRSDLRPTRAPVAAGAAATHVATTAVGPADPSEAALLDALEHDVIPFLAASNPSRSPGRATVRGRIFPAAPPAARPRLPRPRRPALRVGASNAARWNSRRATTTGCTRGCSSTSRRASCSSS